MSRDLAHPADVLEGIGGRVQTLSALGLLLLTAGTQEQALAIRGAALGMIALAEDFERARAEIMAWVEGSRG